MKRALTLTFLTLFAACNSKTPLLQRRLASMPPLPPPELGEVWSSRNDQQAEEILQKTLNLLERRAARDSFTRRDAHPKAHACVPATVTFDPTPLAQDLRVGVFAPDTPKQYQAWIRFSNGAPDGATAHDLEKDVRGMAVKLMNVPGASSGSLDLVMINAEEFFSKDGKDYLDLHEAISGSNAHLLWYGITHPRSASRILAARIQVGHPLFVNYFSSVPYKLGARSMRFSVRPCQMENHPLPKKNSPPHFLRERLLKTLSEKAGCFDFYVQPNMDTRNNVIEDPRLSWPAMHSPVHKVGQITIPVNSQLSSKELANFCENVSMNPWHTRPDMRPLGQINRMRALVYAAISKYRHEKNGTVEVEPVNHQPCSGATASLCQTPVR